jgi:adiponectin receptor
MLEWNASLEDRFYFTFFALCCAITMLVSSVYHICRPHSVEVYRFCLTCDLRGIILLLCGGNTLCIAQSLKMYIQFRSIMQIINFISYWSLTMWIPTCVKNRLAKKRTIYFALYATLAAIAWTMRHVLLIVNRTQLTDTTFYISYKEASFDHLYGLTVTYLIMGSGLVLFAGKFPERLFPKRFDIIGSSHQLFHLSVAIGAYFAVGYMTRLYKQSAFPGPDYLN